MLLKAWKKNNEICKRFAIYFVILNKIFFALNFFSFVPFLISLSKKFYTQYFLLYLDIRQNSSSLLYLKLFVLFLIFAQIVIVLVIVVVLAMVNHHYSCCFFCLSYLFVFFNFYNKYKFLHLQSCFFIYSLVS